MKIVNLMRKLGVLLFVLMFVPFFLAIMGVGEFNSTNSGSLDSIVNSIGGWHIVGFGMMMLAFLLYFGGSAVNGILNQRLLFKGEDALARITGTSDTGERANENPVLDFVLDVRPGNYPSFTGHCRQTVPPDKTAFYRTGGKVGVKFIPGSDKVAILGYSADDNEFEAEFSRRPAPAASGSSVVPVGNRSATKYYLTIAGIVLLPIAVAGFVAYVLLLFSKHTPEYACAVSSLKENTKAIEMFGVPIEFGFTATGNVTGSGASRNVHFETAVSGPKGEGKLKVESYRIKDGYSRMKMTLVNAGENTDVFDDAYPCK